MPSNTQGCTEMPEATQLFWLFWQKYRYSSDGHYTWAEEISSVMLDKLTWPQLSQVSEPLRTDPGQKSGVSVCRLIST